MVAGGRGRLALRDWRGAQRVTVGWVPRSLLTESRVPGGACKAPVREAQWSASEPIKSAWDGGGTSPAGKELTFWVLGNRNRVID